jgi:hypothetical protein
MSHELMAAEVDRIKQSWLQRNLDRIIDWARRWEKTFGEASNWERGWIGKGVLAIGGGRNM